VTSRQLPCAVRHCPACRFQKPPAAPLGPRNSLCCSKHVPRSACLRATPTKPASDTFQSTYPASCSLFRFVCGAVLGPRPKFFDLPSPPASAQCSPSLRFAPNLRLTVRTAFTDIAVSPSRRRGSPIPEMERQRCPRNCGQELTLFSPLVACNRPESAPSPRDPKISVSLAKTRTAKPLPLVRPTSATSLPKNFPGWDAVLPSYTHSPRAGGQFPPP